MSKSIKIHEECFATFGSEICVSIFVILRKRIHTLVLHHSNCDGGWENRLKVKFSTPAGFTAALEKAECEDFSLHYDFDKMEKRAKGLPNEFRSMLPKIKTERAGWDKPVKTGNHTFTVLSPKESGRRYGNSTIFVGRSFADPKVSTEKAGSDGPSTTSDSALSSNSPQQKIT
jgi:hypothetical protein